MEENVKLAGTSSDLPDPVRKYAEAELAKIKDKYGYIRPDRGNLDDPTIEWRQGKPNYALADLTFFRGRSKVHRPGSLERIVEDLVKTWEMEASHKLSEWTTISKTTYTVQANGGPEYNLEKSKSMGNYNWLLESCPNKQLYDSSKESFESSHEVFRSAFPAGFPWEIVQVFSGPPQVACTWRHWGEFTGSYKGHAGVGQLAELTGFAMFTVDSDMKIEKIQIFYDIQEFLHTLMGTAMPSSSTSQENKLLARGSKRSCPFSSSG